MAKPKDISGQRFGRLTAIEMVGKTKDGNVKWMCVCDCGNKKVVSQGDLHSGTISCGCYAKEKLAERNRKNATHHGTKTRLYQTWQNMRRRCSDTNCPEYYLYGGRGIEVCDEWDNSYEPFMNWAKENGYKRDLTIDRIDVNGNYEPNNCRWVTPKQQANNRRTNNYITINGETRTLTQWCEINGVNCSTAFNRIKYGWDVQDAVTLPPSKIKYTGRHKYGEKEGATQLQE